MLPLPRGMWRGAARHPRQMVAWLSPCAATHHQRWCSNNNDNNTNNVSSNSSPARRFTKRAVLRGATEQTTKAAPQKTEDATLTPQLVHVAAPRAPSSLTQPTPSPPPSSSPQRRRRRRAKDVDAFTPFVVRDVLPPEPSMVQLLASSDASATLISYMISLRRLVARELGPELRTRVLHLFVETLPQLLPHRSVQYDGEVSHTTASSTPLKWDEELAEAVVSTASVFMFRPLLRSSILAAAVEHLEHIHHEEVCTVTTSTATSSTLQDLNVHRATRLAKLALSIIRILRTATTRTKVEGIIQHSAGQHKQDSSLPSSQDHVSRSTMRDVLMPLERLMAATLVPQLISCLRDLCRDDVVFGGAELEAFSSICNALHKHAQGGWREGDDVDDDGVQHVQGSAATIPLAVWRRGMEGVAKAVSMHVAKREDLDRRMRSPFRSQQHQHQHQHQQHSDGSMMPGSDYDDRIAPNDSENNASGAGCATSSRTSSSSPTTLSWSNFNVDIIFSILQLHLRRESLCTFINTYTTNDDDDGGDDVRALAGCLRRLLYVGISWAPACRSFQLASLATIYGRLLTSVKPTTKHAQKDVEAVVLVADTHTRIIRALQRTLAIHDDLTHPVRVLRTCVDAGFIYTSMFLTSDAVAYMSGLSHIFDAVRQQPQLEEHLTAVDALRLHTLLNKMCGHVAAIAARYQCRDAMPFHVFQHGDWATPTTASSSSSQQREEDAAPTQSVALRPPNLVWKLMGYRAREIISIISPNEMKTLLLAVERMRVAPLQPLVEVVHHFLFTRHLLRYPSPELAYIWQWHMAHASLGEVSTVWTLTAPPKNVAQNDVVQPLGTRLCHAVRSCIVAQYADDDDDLAAEMAELLHLVAQMENNIPSSSSSSSPATCGAAHRESPLRQQQRHHLHLDASGFTLDVEVMGMLHWAASGPRVVLYPQHHRLVMIGLRVLQELSSTHNNNNNNNKTRTNDGHYTCLGRLLPLYVVLRYVDSLQHSLQNPIFIQSATHLLHRALHILVHHHVRQYARSSIVAIEGAHMTDVAAMQAYLLWHITTRVRTSATTSSEASVPASSALVKDLLGVLVDRKWENMCEHQRAQIMSDESERLLHAPIMAQNGDAAKDSVRFLRDVCARWLPLPLSTHSAWCERRWMQSAAFLPLMSMTATTTPPSSDIAQDMEMLLSLDEMDHVDDGALRSSTVSAARTYPGYVLQHFTIMLSTSGCSMAMVSWLMQQIFLLDVELLRGTSLLTSSSVQHRLREAVRDRIGVLIHHLHPHEAQWHNTFMADRELMRCFIWMAMAQCGSTSTSANNTEDQQHHHNNVLRRVEQVEVKESLLAACTKQLAHSPRYAEELKQLEVLPPSRMTNIVIVELLRTLVALPEAFHATRVQLARLVLPIYLSQHHAKHAANTTFPKFLLVLHMISPTLMMEALQWKTPSAATTWRGTSARPSVAILYASLECVLLLHQHHHVANKKNNSNDDDDAEASPTTTNVGDEMQHHERGIHNYARATSTIFRTLPKTSFRPSVHLRFDLVAAVLALPTMVRWSRTRARLTAFLSRSVSALLNPSPTRCTPTSSSSSSQRCVFDGQPLPQVLLEFPLVVWQLLLHERSTSRSMHHKIQRTRTHAQVADALRHRMGSAFPTLVLLCEAQVRQLRTSLGPLSFVVLATDVLGFYTHLLTRDERRSVVGDEGLRSTVALRWWIMMADEVMEKLTESVSSCVEVLCEEHRSRVHHDHLGQRVLAAERIEEEPSSTPTERNDDDDDALPARVVVDVRSIVGYVEMMDELRSPHAGEIDAVVRLMSLLGIMWSRVEASNQPRVEVHHVSCVLEKRNNSNLSPRIVRGSVSLPPSAGQIQRARALLAMRGIHVDEPTTREADGEIRMRVDGHDDDAGVVAVQLTGLLRERAEKRRAAAMEALLLFRDDVDEASMYAHVPTAAAAAALEAALQPRIQLLNPADLLTCLRVVAERHATWMLLATEANVMNHHPRPWSIYDVHLHTLLGAMRELLVSADANVVEHTSRVVLAWWSQLTTQLPPRDALVMDMQQLLAKVPLVVAADVERFVSVANMLAMLMALHDANPPLLTRSAVRAVRLSMIRSLEGGITNNNNHHEHRIGTWLQDHPQLGDEDVKKAVACLLSSGAFSSATDVATLWDAVHARWAAVSAMKHDLQHLHPSIVVGLLLFMESSAL